MKEITGKLNDKRKQMKRKIIGEKDSLASTLPEDCLVGYMGNMINSICRD